MQVWARAGAVVGGQGTAGLETWERDLESEIAAAAPGGGSDIGTIMCWRSSDMVVEHSVAAGVRGGAKDEGFEVGELVRQLSLTHEPKDLLIAFGCVWVDHKQLQHESVDIHGNARVLRLLKSKVLSLNQDDNIVS